MEDDRERIITKVSSEYIEEGGFNDSALVASVALPCAHAGHVCGHAAIGIAQAPILYYATTVHKKKSGDRLEMKIIVMDVSRAHFHPPAAREMFIRLPAEDHTPGMVGRLLRTLYGTRDAANQWDAFFNKE
eukprot:4132457-Amphidinium_carterae.1